MRRPLILAALLTAAVVLPSLALFLSGTLAGSPCRGEVSDPAVSQAPHHDPELEERIPDAVAGQGIEVQSVCANVADPGGITTAPEFLQDIGVDIDDVTYTTINPSIGAPNAAGSHAVVTAYRYRGASEAVIRDGYVHAMTNLGETIEGRTLGDKDVHVSEGPLSSGIMMYVADDTLYFVSGPDDDSRELLAQLP